MDRQRFKTTSQQQAWADWLQDDPISLSPTKEPDSHRYTADTALQAHTSVSDVIAPEPQPLPSPNVTIEIKLPKLKLGLPAHSLHTPRLRWPKLSTSKLPGRRLVNGIAAGVLVVGLLSAGSLALSSKPSVNTAINAGLNLRNSSRGSVSPVATTASPSYQPLVPSSQPDLAAGKQGRSAYDSSRNSFSFNDQFKGTGIIISEQQMPASPNTPTSVISRAASALKAVQQIQTQYGPAYIATDAKTNGQTIIFGSASVLAFIQSPYTHSATDWQNYINNLK